jgi:hypothetical protein
LSAYIKDGPGATALILRLTPDQFPPFFSQ